MVGVGSGSISANPNYNSTGEGAYDGMFHENNENNWAIVNSAIIMLGNLAVTEAGGGQIQYYWEIYHLMGDPSLSTYIGVPEENNVNFDPFLPIGSEAIEIQANPYSYVGLTQNEELISSGIVDESGYVVLVFDPMNDPTTLDITITAQNTEPFFGQIIVSSPDGAFVTVNDVYIDTGHDDLISIGESVYLNIVLENVGTINSNEINITLSEISNSPYINIADDYYLIDSINAGENINIELNFIINDDSPYGHSFVLNLNINSDENTYNSELALNVENLIESFESGNLSNLSWDITSGDSEWTLATLGSYEGLYSSQSGAIDHNMSSQLSITIDVVEDGNIIFYKKVSCEDVGSSTGNYYDYLSFKIDDVQQAQWAGEQSWSISSFQVNQGVHTFSWEYIKDNAVTEGVDAAWVDQIIFPPTFNNNELVGDVNSDGNINVQDIILVVNIILYGSEYNQFADINSDNIIDVLDVINLVNIILSD